MIQPVNAFNPQATFRGASKKSASKTTDSKIALINACGVATAAGGLGTALARSQTSSWAHASVLGVCAAFLTMFFMTPQLIEKTGISKLSKKSDVEVLASNDSQKAVQAVKEHIKPAKKLIQFRQQA